MNLYFFGGTFDPPHIGHYEIACKCLKLADKVLIIPNKLSLDNKLPHSNTFHRIKMLEILFEKTNVEIDRFEIDSNKKNYTIHTIRYLLDKYKKYRVTMVIGLDQLKNLNNWYKYNEIKDLVEILCFNRNNVGISDQIFKGNNIDEEFKINVSSTIIRDAFKQKKSSAITKFLDINVLNYIRKNNLYVS